MKKITLLILVFCASIFKMEAQQKVISNKEAKKIANTINSSLNDMAQSIQKMDWHSLNDLINNTVTIIEKHTDAVVQISKSIDTKQLERNATQLANNINKSIDTQQLEKRLEDVSKKLENSFKEPIEK